MDTRGHEGTSLGFRRALELLSREATAVDRTRAAQDVRHEPIDDGIVPTMELLSGKNDEAIDRRGVDREQIRRMLQLSPLERLRWLEEFVESIVEIRRLNEKRPIR